MTRKGKIAQLPFAVREQLNLRLRDGQLSPKILPWLNSEMGFKGRACITDGNLSEWRAGGYQDWLKGQAKIDHVRQLSEFSLRVAQAGGGAMDLPAAIAGGQIMELLESVDPGNFKELLGADPSHWIKVLEVLARLQRSKADEKVAGQNDVKLQQNARRLELEELRYQVKTCELFVKWIADKRAADLAADQALKPDVKIAKLRELMFGPAKEQPDA